MQADFSVELGGDNPALEIPWSSDDPAVRYFDLKHAPELVATLPEVVTHPQLGAFLGRINAPGFPLATAKCDAWFSREIAPEEEIFGGDRKFVSYIDLVFEDEASRYSLEKHETFASELCGLLAHAPDIAATVEIVIRRCYFHRDDSASRNAASGDAAGDATSGDTASGDATDRDAMNRNLGRAGPDPDTSVSGFGFTAYVTGFGDEENEPRRRWEIALALMQHALVQLSRT